VFVSNDHDDASATVAALAESLGFAAIEVGEIAEGGRLIQARGPLVFQNLIKYRCKVGRKATVVAQPWMETELTASR
jgi:predicted dinucleotide-binding enzyme